MVIVLFTYILYIGCHGLKVFLGYKKKDELAKGFGNLAKDICVQGFIFFLYILILQINAVHAFGAAMTYIYMISFILLAIGNLKPDKWKLRLIGFGI